MNSKLLIIYLSLKCFIHCYLIKVGVLKNDILDRERADGLRLTRNEDILDDCAKESRGKTKNATLETCSFNEFIEQ